MTDGAGWIFGGTALASIALAGWAYLKGVGRQLLGRMIASFEGGFQLAHVVDFYARAHFKPSPFSSPRFDAAILNVRPRSREQLVVAEEVSNSGKLYWHGWRPIWIQLSSGGSNPVALKCWYIRGTFDTDVLLINAAEYFNQTVLGDCTPETGSRYGVRHAFGTAGKSVVRDSASGTSGDSGSAATISQSSVAFGDMADDRARRSRRVLKWSHDEIGPSLIQSGKSIDRLALSEDVSAAVAEFEQWLSLESWYKSRGIPWRLNWLCYGPPGTGKSSIVQALAEDHGLPICVFDLATLYNDELHREWNRMLAQVPCIALIEDLDKVFEGSRNVSKGDLTLDCLLNCIDGVSRASGLFLVMTTNRIDVLDSALKRPGRADCILEMGPLELSGRRKVASRILPEYPDVVEMLALDNAGMNGAEFQRVCEQAALGQLRAHRHERNGHRLQEACKA